MAAPPQLRILCLHDANSSAALLKEQLDILGQRLWKNHGEIDLVYVNSPITTTLSALQGEHALRVWWEEQHTKDSSLDPHSNENPEQLKIPNYLGLDASLLLLKQIWLSTPFWGLLGVGQGAAVAALLALLVPTLKEAVPPPSFCIFVSGQTLFPERERLIDDSLPCLHLIAVAAPTGNDSGSTTITERTLASHELLLRQFGGTVHHVAFNKTATNHRQSSILKSKDALNAIGRFVCLQKKQLLSSESGRQIVALHTALHLTEQQAADRIATEIAMDPPPALMAVIRPQDVAGWSGNKRRQPGEEGGGAPCPSDFLLKREKRKNDKNSNSSGGSVSRVHPKQTPTPNYTL